jgi:hypothetical protein
MYRLLDLCTCESDVRITPHLPSAIVDFEHVLIAVVSRNGHLIFQNRAFMKANQVHSTGSGGLNVREALPELWRSLSDAQGTGRRPDAGGESFPGVVR